MTAVAIHDGRPCALGEGALWHPERGVLFWVDILGRRLMSRERVWQFEEQVSAAGWVDRDRLLLASETALFTLDLESGARATVCGLEAESPGTRANDGRADPWGGFWIGTMGKAAEPGAGAIYRYYRGELRRLHAPWTIPNAICFSPDRAWAYLADSPTRTILRQPLAPEDGWPAGPAEPWLTLDPEDGVPDGAVCDATGNVWNARWSVGRVACHAPDGTLLSMHDVPARLTTCPAFGGPDLTRLYVTTARESLGAEVLAAEPQNGMTFALPDLGPGLPEYRVSL